MLYCHFWSFAWHAGRSAPRDGGGKETYSPKLEVYHFSHLHSLAQRMLSVIQMEKLRLHKSNIQNRWERIWGPFLAKCQVDTWLDPSPGTCFSFPTVTRFSLQNVFFVECKITTVWQFFFVFVFFFLVLLIYFLFFCKFNSLYSFANSVKLNP